MAEGASYDNVPIRVVRSENEGGYVIGAVVNDAFLPFGFIKLGDADERIERVAKAKAQAAQSNTASPQETPPA